MSSGQEPEMIIGAGLTGLIAAHVWRRAAVFDGAAERRTGGAHKALLRFRSEAVSDVTGIPFRRVNVTKGIWFRGSYVAGSPMTDNLYSKKVLGRALPRSIGSLDAVTRWIAPEDFYPRLLERVGARVAWNSPVTIADLPLLAGRPPIVTTAPLNSTLQTLDWAAAMLRPEVVFQRAPIHVRRWRLAGWDVHQTVYFPDPALRVYRASITGDLLIVESGAGDADLQAELEAVRAAFGIDSADRACELGGAAQEYGKIAEIEPRMRRALLLALTQRERLYSLGRFATWRNVLLDDVVHDIKMIQQLLATDAYGQLHAASHFGDRR